MSQAGSFFHVLLKCSFTFGSSDLFGRYSKCAWDSDLSAQDCYTTYLNFYGTVSSRLLVKQLAKRTKPFSTPKPLFCFCGEGPCPQFCAVEKSLGLLLSPNCRPIKRPCNFSLRRSQWPIISAKLFSSGIKEGLESLPRTQTSLIRWHCAQRKAGRRTASHGPLRFVITHSRFLLTSVRKTKRLRRRLGESHFSWLSRCLAGLGRAQSFAPPCDYLERLHLPLS